MSLSVAIVGLPNAGKSTLFNALLSRQIANVAPYPFCTIEPNIGIVEVPDERLAVLAKVVKTEIIVPAVVEFVDIAGLVKGASQGQGLGNKFLSHVRECQAIIHVLRTFEGVGVSKEGSLNPQADFEIIKTELCLADLQTLEKQKEPNPSIATKEEKKKWETVVKLRKSLGEGIEVRNIILTDAEKEIIESLFLLTAKPVLLVLNIEEKDVGLNNKALGEKFGIVEDENLIPICAKTEMELADLNPEERIAYLKELGLEESSLEKLIKNGYMVLGLQTFLTAGVKEVRAWTINKGATAPQAAGVIHTDFEKGFIKAQICNYDDFVKYEGWSGASLAGKTRLEGKDYLMQEGDVVEFKFSV